MQLLGVLLIFCKITLSWSVASQFTTAQQNTVVDKHNTLRSSETNAANMLRMSWDHTIAEYAQELADKCVWGHGLTSGLTGANFESVGQNNFATTSATIDAAAGIQSWYDEKPDYTHSNCSCDSGEVCGHYTQVVWHDSFAVGCGYASCSSLYTDASKTNAIFNGAAAIMMVCNYGNAGNMGGQCPYESGTSCSNCPSTKTTCTDSLCSEAPNTIVGDPHFRQKISKNEFMCYDVTGETGQCISLVTDTSKMLKVIGCLLDSYYIGRISIFFSSMNININLEKISVMNGTQTFDWNTETNLRFFSMHLKITDSNAIKIQVKNGPVFIVYRRQNNYSSSKYLDIQLENMEFLDESKGGLIGFVSNSKFEVLESPQNTQDNMQTIRINKRLVHGERVHRNSNECILVSLKDVIYPHAIKNFIY